MQFSRADVVPLVSATLIGMRLVLVAIATAIVAAAGVLAFAPRPVASPVAAATTEAPRVTADPATFARVDPDTDRGRLAASDRSDRRTTVVRGLRLPIDGVPLPTDPVLLPNSARDYRGGWHEGIDFPAPAGVAVRAVAPGTIVRIDRDFVDWDAESERIALFEAVQLGYTPASTLDRIRGRQVWIDHGHGVVTRYAHLSAVARLGVGQAVEAGDVIGAVGSSGYPEGGPHLHMEVRIGTSYLGDGLDGDALFRAVEAAFD